MPTFVVQPQNKNEIQKVLKFANDKKVPVNSQRSWHPGDSEASSRQMPG